MIGEDIVVYYPTALSASQATASSSFGQLPAVVLDNFVAVAVVLRWSNHSIIYRDNCGRSIVDVESSTAVNWVMQCILSSIHHSDLSSIHQLQPVVAFSNILRSQALEHLG